MILRIQALNFFRESRDSAGIHNVAAKLRELDHPLGRHKVLQFMAEANLVSSQPGQKFKKMGQPKVNIPNLLELLLPFALAIQVW